MKTTIVLAMHGAPPKDFPPQEVIELFSLHARLEHVDARLPQEQVRQWQQRFAELDAKIRGWPRTPENDPFFSASQELARHLASEIGRAVIAGFNEFCAPTIDQALQQAAASSERVVVITPMMTPGGEHSEQDIPAAIQRARDQFPQVEFVYAWPFELQETARFLASQIQKKAGETAKTGR